MIISMRRVTFLLVALTATAILRAAPPAPPKTLHPATGNAILPLADGSLEHYYTTGDEGKQAVMCIRSRDRGESWSEPQRVFTAPADKKWTGGYPVPLIDRNGDLHLFLLDLKEKGMATWHAKRGSDGAWSTPTRVCPCGPQTLAVQLKSGRIVLPIGFFVPTRAWDDLTGRGAIASWYSDDDGAAWQRSPGTLTIAGPMTYPGVRYGAWEPIIIELTDGRLWMLIRTQHGWLYESFSDDGGVRWSEARATDFRSPDAPGALTRLPTGELILVWNNCESPAPQDGRWIYNCREALHAAISSDDGQTWRGHREIYLDPKRDETPPPRGDRGTGYPNVSAAPDGTLYLVSGQGPGRSMMFRIDPAWLTATSREDDFSAGLDAWSVFKCFGPVDSYRQERVAGAQRVAHPTRDGGWALHVRRPDEKVGDGAAWNFPAGTQGRVALRIMLKEGFGGGLVTLTDRFYYPQDTDRSKVAFALSLPADGRIGETGKLKPGKWHTLELAWKVEHTPPRGAWPGTCTVSIDGREVATLPQLNRAKAGPSYLRLHSTAPSVDTAGFLIERVAASVEPPAPAKTAQ